MHSTKTVLAALLISTPLVLHGYQVNLGNTHEQQTTPLDPSRYGLNAGTRHPEPPRRFELLQPRHRTTIAGQPANQILLRPRPVIQPISTPPVLLF